MTYKITSYYEAPRWCNVSGSLKTLCHMTNCTLDITVEKRWLMETGWYTVTGTKDNLKSFIKLFDLNLRTDE